jgi:hypothetical protein
MLHFVADPFLSSNCHLQQLHSATLELLHNSREIWSVEEQVGFANSAVTNGC